MYTADSARTTQKKRTWTRAGTASTDLQTHILTNPFTSTLKTTPAIRSRASKCLTNMRDIGTLGSQCITLKPYSPEL